MMGLTESNQNRTSFWGPSKSKSTPHFAEGLYEGKPRQSVTLPARAVTSTLHSPTCKEEDILSSVHSRPPERIKRRDRSLQREDALCREPRTENPLSVRYTRQSDTLVDFPSSPTKFFTSTPRTHGVTSSVKPDKIGLSPNPHQSNRSISCHRCPEEKTVDATHKKNRSRSRNARKRDSSSCSRKNCVEGVTVSEKETQTFPERPSSPNIREKSELSISLLENDSMVEDTRDGFPCRRPRGRRISRKPVSATSRSVPSTPSGIESEPYVCLHYVNNINVDKVNEEKSTMQINSSRSMYSEACHYMDTEMESTLQKSNSDLTPTRKKSQIIIQIANDQRSDLDNSDAVNGNGKAVEIGSNVWFETNVQEQPYQMYSPDKDRSIMKSKSFKDLKCQRIDTTTQNNDPLSSASKLSFGSRNPGIKKKNHSNLNKLNKVSSEHKNSAHPINRSISLHNDIKLACPLESNSKERLRNPSFIELLTNEVENICNGIFEESQETIKKRPLSNNVNIDSPLNVVGLIRNNGFNTLSKDKEIPAVDINDGRFCNEVNDCNVGKLLEQTTSDCEISEVNGGDNATKSEVQCVRQFTPSDSIPYFVSDSSRGTTLPSNSFNCHRVTSTDPWHEQCTGIKKEMLRRKTIHNVEVGEFPVLRLPKLDSQPKLVDILRREFEKKESDRTKEFWKEITDLELENGINSELGRNYSPLDENILYITEEETKALESSPSVIEPTDGEVMPTTTSVDQTLRQLNLSADSFIKEDDNTIWGATSSELNTKDILHDTCTARPREREDLNYCKLTKGPSLNKDDSSKEGVGLPSISPRNPRDFLSQTIPSKARVTKGKRLKRFFSLRIKSPLNRNSEDDCNLTCHEQCQNVVSLDCKSHSPDTDSLFQEERDLACYCRDETLPVDEIEKGDVQDTEKGDKELNLVEAKEEVVDEEEEEEEEEEKEKIEGFNGREEEEKHEEEMLEKEIKLEPDVHFQQNTLKRQEVSTLRRTVRRIQSQAVDSDKIEEWVQKCPVNNVGLQIAKENDGGYRGCLRIHLNLSRPINIVAGTRPPSIYDILQEERTLEKTLTSFYMPRDAVKAIHITSKTTTREVIVALLRKFKVVDNPQKFALYERTYDTGQSMRAKLRRLSDNECPLVLAIAWNAQGLINKRLVLQENDTADIQWEAFSLPELDNFLRILDREEGEYKNQIRDKYSLLRYKIQAQLSKLNYGNT